MLNVNPVEIDTQIANNDAEIAQLLARVERLNNRNAKLNEVYRAQPWPRYYPAVTDSKPHIHSSTSCQTLHHGRNMTQMTWATEMSGTSEHEAVAHLDEALCSVCFPSAPVALREYVSHKSVAEQVARNADKATRLAVKAAKTLEPGEVFKTSGRFPESVETVAKCKELIRAAINTGAELAWWKAGKSPMTNPDDLNRRIVALEAISAREDADANQAVRVLLAREERQAGHGCTAQDMTKLMANAAKRAAKDWA